MSSRFEAITPVEADFEDAAGAGDKGYFVEVFLEGGEFLSHPGRRGGGSGTCGSTRSRRARPSNYSAWNSIRGGPKEGTHVQRPDAGGDPAYWLMRSSAQAPGLGRVLGCADRGLSQPQLPRPRIVACTPTRTKASSTRSIFSQKIRVQRMFAFPFISSAR